jgi:hypothetical protein
LFSDRHEGIGPFLFIFAVDIVADNPGVKAEHNGGANSSGNVSPIISHKNLLHPNFGRQRSNDTVLIRKKAKIDNFR